MPKKKKVKTYTPINLIFSLDCETSGLKIDGSIELISLTIVKHNFETDYLEALYDKMFMPVDEITNDAIEVHGITKEILKKKGAKVFNKSDAKKIVMILKDANRVVAFGKHDQDAIA